MTQDRRAATNDAAVMIFSKLDPAAIALLLDVDGTIIDLAPTPQEVHVSRALCDSLARLLALTDGAMALVSGRPITDLDRLFAPLKLPIIGGHGAEIRIRGDEVVSAVSPLPESLREKLRQAETFDPGILIEDKGYSLALHYRKVPQLEERLRRHIEAVRAAYPGEAVDLLPGKALFEVKRPGVSKGEAVRTLMHHAPFAGRRPVFVGDDVTDESVFALLPELGGLGFSVQRPFEGITGIFRSPTDVRRALQRLAAVDGAKHD